MTRMRWFRRKVLGFAVAVFLVSLPAAAQSNAEALVTQGIEQREQGHDEEALKLFERAYALDPSPRTLGQIGLAEQALGAWVRAESHLSEALESHDPWIDRHRRTLVTALSVIREHVGDLDVRGTPNGAQVFVDGVLAGALPLPHPLRVSIGRHLVELRAEGYVGSSRETEVRAQSLVRETVDLAKQRQDPKAKAAPAATAEPKTSAPSAEPEGGSSLRTAAYFVGGVGVAGLLVGGGSLLLHQSIVADYNATCPGADTPDLPAACQDKLSSGNTWRTVAIASSVSGAALLAGGVVLLLSAPSSAKRVALGPLGGTLGLMASGVF
jgi:hypothetical protein